MRIKNFILDVMGFGLASFLTKSAALLVVPILTRNLSASDYGAFEILVGFSALATVIVSMSLESYLAREWGRLGASKEKGNLLSSLFFFVSFVSVLFGFAVWSLGGAFSSLLFETAEFSSAVFLLSLSGALTALCGLPLMALRMERRIAPYLVIVGFQSLSYIVLILLLLEQQDISVSSVALSMLLSSALALILSCFLIRHLIYLKVDLSLLKPAFRHSLPLLPAVGVTWINAQVDKYALLYFYDTKTVGEFAIVTKLAALAAMGVMVFRQAWLPYSYALARRPGHSPKQFNLVLTTYYVLALIVCLVIVYFAEYIFLFLAPAEYLIEFEVLPVLLLATIVYGSASIVNVGTMISGKTEWNSYASLIGVVLNILLTIVLVPLFGVAGAAWGTLVASAVFVVVLAWRTSKELKVDFGLMRTLFLITGFLACAFSIL